MHISEGPKDCVGLNRTHLTAGYFKKNGMSYLRLFHPLYLNSAKNLKKLVWIEKRAVLARKGNFRSFFGAAAPGRPAFGPRPVR